MVDYTGLAATFDSNDSHSKNCPQVNEIESTLPLEVSQQDRSHVTSNKPNEWLNVTMEQESISDIFDFVKLTTMSDSNLINLHDDDDDHGDPWDSFCQFRNNIFFK